MNTDEIYSVLSGDTTAKRIFGGVMAADEFASVYAGFRRLAQGYEERLFVVNADTSDGPGSHWVVVHRRLGVTRFFDSYGLPSPNFTTIHPTIREDTPISSGASLQAYGSDVCGDYCVLYALCVARGWSSQDFTTFWLSVPVEDRDSLARYVVRSIMDA